MLATLDSLTREAGQLKAAGRMDEALALYRQAAQRFPSGGVALHNLAGLLGDLGQHSEAAQMAAHALKTGLDAPETWLVLARADLGRGELDRARRAYREVLLRRPNALTAHFEAAQLVWMTTGDRVEALRGVEAALCKPGADPMLCMVKAQALEFMGDAPSALAALTGWAAEPGCPAQLLAYAAHLSAETGDPAAALVFAERGVRAAPEEQGALEALARARLAAGDVPGAQEILEPLFRQFPGNQHVLAMLAVTWRLTGDPRYRALYDYARFVQARPLSIPKGWGDLQSYVAALAAELKAAHPFRAHPFGHSLRQGSQLPDVLRRTSPAIAAFTEALAGPLAAYLTHIRQGEGPLPARNSGRVALAGSWSVWLRPGGYHVDHVHQEGWISSACYIELPGAVMAGGRQGWLRFGRPGLALAEELAAEHWIRPEPGLVALFPSYMWHGTEPFSGDEPRLTMAFDLVPG
ncbi:MAG: putative 2OG-Fe(II) oxygenase [Rubrivivax sp.]|nr:putative 2OG-Fe(II) oxygenase [Rubrivivax sp.]